ncbi:hypothetical protein PG995_002140 [Apiospora arundinis]
MTQWGLVLMKVGPSDALVISAPGDSGGFLALELGPNVDWPKVQEERGTTELEVDYILLFPTAWSQHLSRVHKTEPQSDSQGAASKSKDAQVINTNKGQEDFSARIDSRAGAVHSLPLLCRFWGQGLDRCEWHATSGVDNTTVPREINTSHLQPDEGDSNQAVWFASCATAVQAVKSPPILSFRILDHVFRFVRTNKLPCGVLKLLGMVKPSEFGFRENQANIEQVDGSVTSQGYNIGQWNISERGKYVAEEEAAFMTPRWSIQKVASSCLRWLQALNRRLADLSLADVVVTILYQMAVGPRLQGPSARCSNGGGRGPKMTICGRRTCVR